MLLRITAILCFSIFFTGCVSLEYDSITPRDKFPEFYDNPSYPEKITLVLDTIVLSDLRGTDIGFNRDKNAQARSLVESAFIEELEKRGHSVDLLYHGDGFSYDVDGSVNYFYSENRKSTALPYEGATKQEENDQWVSFESKEFFLRLLEDAAESDENYRKRTELASVVNMPEFVQNLSEDTLLLFGRTYITDVSLIKKVGVNSLAIALSAGLTGGTVILAMGPESGSNIDIVALDTSTSKIRWYNNRYIEGGSSYGGTYRNIDKGAKDALGYFPTISGATIDWKAKPPTGCRTLTQTEIECPKN